jgi:hypothetical protein
MSALSRIRFTAVRTLESSSAAPIISEQTDRKIFGTKTRDLAFLWRLGARGEEHEEATYFGAGNSARCVVRGIGRSRWQ